jgi:subtilisin family serine protease
MTVLDQPARRVLETPPVLRAAGILLLFAAPLLFDTPLAAAEDVEARLKAAAAAVCTATDGDAIALAGALGGAVRLDVEPMEMRGQAVGSRERFMLKDGAWVYVERFAPGGTLRRLTIVYHAPPARSRRPERMVIANGDCRIVSGRRLVYEGPGAPAFIERTDASLTQVEVREPLNPPLPQGGTSHGVPVALVDSGVNYLLEDIQRHMARDSTGASLGYDYWDLDERPFDANPARSQFFPQRHGTKTAGILITEAPLSRLVVYRYPRPQMSRMTDLVEDAARKGVVIVNLSLGSKNADEWAAFAEAARNHPEMLFIASAGNNGRNIDEQPVFPAALKLPNLLTVTSSEANGLPAEGSNWGPGAVDLLVPAEGLVSIDFYGRPKLVSGSSYAAARISALAACLLAAHPEWRAQRLKAEILAQVKPSMNDVMRFVSGGFLASPTESARGVCPAEPDSVAVISDEHHGTEALYGGSGFPEGVTLAMAPALVVLEGTTWSPALLESVAREAAQIFAQCGVGFKEFRLYQVRTPRRYLYFNEQHASSFVKDMEVARPAVFFVRDTLRRLAFDAEAIGHANGRRRPSLVDTVWMTEAVGHSGSALAHELYHVLADTGRHSDDPANLMYAETRGENIRLDEAQCLRLRKTGVAFGHLTPVNRNEK